jgi:hypothetical protein
VELSSIPQYAFTAWCLVKAQGQLYLYLYNFTILPLPFTIQTITFGLAGAPIYVYGIDVGYSESNFWNIKNSAGYCLDRQKTTFKYIRCPLLQRS